MNIIWSYIFKDKTKISKVNLCFNLTKGNIVFMSLIISCFKSLIMSSILKWLKNNDKII